jgi:hypothetical protein
VRGTGNDTRFVPRSGNLGNDLADVRAAKASTNGNGLALIFILAIDRSFVGIVPGQGKDPLPREAPLQTDLRRIERV